jgi:cob(I)alamin adenosyltransferase
MGLVHIYCGDGKGKTTASVGLAVRCAGSGEKVLFCQFMKSGTSSELEILKKIDNIIVADNFCISKFSFKMNSEEKKFARIGITEQMKKAENFLELNNVGMIVLDEIIAAINAGFIDEKTVIEFIKKYREKSEIVLSGRNPSDKLIEIADYVSCIKKIKHPFDRGISARIGIEK